MSFGEEFLYFPDLFPARPSGEPWGDEQVTLQFAGHIYTCTGLSTIQALALRQRFNGFFLLPKETLCSGVDIQIFRASSDDFNDRERLWSFDFEFDYAPDAMRIAGFHCMGRLDWTPRMRASLWTSEDVRLVSHAIFENFFRMVVAYHLFERGGLLLHSAAVVNNEKAYIFFGPSGAGKSTISRLSAASGYAVLSDDMNALRVTSTGITVEQLPFAGDFGQTGNGIAGAYPLRTLCRLYKGSEPTLQTLRPATGVAELLGCVPFINRNPYHRDSLIERLQNLYAKIPVRALTFALDNRFWSLLRS